jgi:hypothetical protein
MEAQNKRKAHSAEYLDDDRFEWWNPDFLELLAQRWCLAEAQSLADIGVGLGH